METKLCKIQLRVHGQNWHSRWFSKQGSGSGCSGRRDFMGFEMSKDRICIGYLGDLLRVFVVVFSNFILFFNSFFLQLLQNFDL
jgi:hypothetical protein